MYNFCKFNSNLPSSLKPSIITLCSPPPLDCWVSKIGRIIFLLLVLTSGLKAQHVVLNIYCVPDIC